jgi:hypothetical protein
VGEFRAGLTFTRYYWQLELDERLSPTGRDIVKQLRAVGIDPKMEKPAASGADLLLAGQTVVAISTLSRKRLVVVLMVIGIVGAIGCGVTGALAQDHEAQAGSFLGSGIFVLTALLAGLKGWMQRSSHTTQTMPRLGRLGVRNAKRLAIQHAKRFMHESSERRRIDTPFTLAGKNSNNARQRAHARWASHWRPRFLAALAMTNSVLLSARHARVNRTQCYEEKKADPDFAKQWDAAIEDALELLHSRVWQRALEGDVEPVWYMGVPVAYLRKFDSKLQIELLRAWKPDRFKTAGVNVNVGARGDVFVLTEDQRHELRSINRQFLLDSPVIDAEFEKLPET